MPATDEVKAIEELMESQELILAQLKKVIIGQEEVINQMLMALFAGGHCLLEGVPGLAKTLMIRTLAQILDLKFKRIQFTPDLMPADITGTDVLEEDRTTGHRTIRLFKDLFSPTSSSLMRSTGHHRKHRQHSWKPCRSITSLLAAPNSNWNSLSSCLRHKTQSSKRNIPAPRGPIGSVYVQNCDRLSTENEETDIVTATTGAEIPELETALSGEAIVALHKIVRRVPAADNVVQYAVKIARATRPKMEDAPDFIKQWVRWGAGPRAGQYLILGAKARAILRGRYNASCEDVKSVAPAVLRHRILTNFHAEAEGVDSDTVIQRLLDTVKEPAVRF